MADTRLRRVGRLISELVSRLIVTRTLKDPRIKPLVSVSDVDVSPDLQHARVKLSGYLSTKELEAAVKALNGASGFIQRELASQVKLKRTPKLEFELDPTIRESFEVIDRINKLD
jgi:ribosome-binding factor A